MQMVVVPIFYFMLCQSFLLSTVIRFVYTKTNGGSIKECELSSVWKYLKKNPFIPSPH